MESYHIKNNFFYQAKKLKKEFDYRFDITCQKETPLNRCIWDYWYVRDQYNYLVTPAYNIFEKKTLKKFEEKLLSWVFKNLGCTEINSMWCSNYIHSCGQNLHMDINQGMWTYVYSLTDWQHREFTGGETILLRPEILDFRHNVKKIENIEITSATDRIFTKVPSRFNQLLLFDGRIPHGVQTVNGTNTVTKGRTVIHGWIKPPQFLVLHDKKKEKSLERKLLSEIIISLDKLFKEYRKLNLHGVLVIRVSIRKGRVKFSILPSTVRPIDNKRRFDKLSKEVQMILTNLFQKRRLKQKDIIIPIVFDSEKVQINTDK